MKRGIRIFFVIVLFAALLHPGCRKDNEILPDTVYTQWQVIEMNFTSDKTYQDAFNDVDLDVIFTHKDGTQLKMPAFWNGGNTWTVRFAPTLTGVWSYKTVCTDEDNSGLHNQTGDFLCKKYEGSLDIYKWGFIKTIPGKRYFTYNNGSPFFYIGDMHANLPAIDLDDFKTIIDKRVEQGFTVIQSEPLEAGYDLSDGVTEDDMVHFRNLDDRFKYLAEKGLVHANSQFFFVSTLNWAGSKYPDSYLEKLSRYWVARYSAYPVMWTTAQECDNDFYNEFDINTNPWKKVATYIHKYDPYNHPLTAHMEYVSYTDASNSSFRDVPGHSWWAVQWSARKNGQLNFEIPEDFRAHGQFKVTILYEGSFDYLWTNHFGARMQGWTAFLNGMYGYGYGAADIWLYNSTYNMDVPTTRDGITITVEMKHTKWPESLEFETAYQMGYMKDFLTKNQWWELAPRFNDSRWFEPDNSYYSIASKGSDIYMIYFYNPDRKTGRVKNLENAAYTVEWFNPRTGKVEESKTVTINDGRYIIGDKPDIYDWVLTMKK